MIKKLAAIYSLWDGVELLEASMASVRLGVDLFIIVWQDVSNWGERYDPNDDVDLLGLNATLVKYTPKPGQNAGQCEREKRNLGLDVARRNGCTHFLHMDCDEFYEDFTAAKQQYIDSGAVGSVAPILTYFKRPTLRLAEPDNYYVPFIHELQDSTIAGASKYPYYVDPTRAINTKNVVLIDQPMHHFSWVRNDIERKALNSTARNNIAKSQLLQDYHDPSVGEGSTLVDYQGQHLISVPDLFNLEPLLD